MKTFIIALSTSFALTGTAFAQDAFTGFYGGVGFGYGFHQEGGMRTQSATIGGVNSLQTNDVAEATLLAGYTTGLGDWIIGGEVELAFGEVDFSENDCVAFNPVAAIATGPCADAGIFAQRGTTLRARALAGQAVTADTLVFATLGLSAANVSMSGGYAVASNGLGAGISGGSGTSFDETAFGFNVGVGAEHSVGNGWSLRGDVAFERLFFESPVSGGGGASSGGNIAQYGLTRGDTLFIENVRFGVSVIRRF